MVNYAYNFLLSLSYLLTLKSIIHLINFIGFKYLLLEIYKTFGILKKEITLQGLTYKVTVYYN